jgi:hypothetical protein
MRKVIGILAVAGLLAMGLPAGATTLGDPVAANNFVFAGGGTPLTNGIFFPGTTICDASSCTGEPLQVPKGEDVTFVNLDVSTATNAHQIVSQKRKRGRPIFASDVNEGPDQSLVITSHLKPGIYKYFCSYHFGMYGQIEIVD